MRRAARSCAGLLIRQLPAGPLDAACSISGQPELFSGQQCAWSHLNNNINSVRYASGITGWWQARFQPRHPAPEPTLPPDTSGSDHSSQGFPSTASNHDHAAVAASDSPSPTDSQPSTLHASTSIPEPIPDAATFWPLPEDSYEAFRAIGQAVRASDVAAIAAVKADAFFSSAWVMSAITYLHDTQGLPWWGAIAGLNIMTKIITFPLALYSQKAAAKTVETNSQMAHISTLQTAAKTAATPEESQRIQQAAQKAYVAYVAEHGSPVKAALKMPAIMIANGMMFLSVFNGVRSLTTSHAYTLTQGGMLWFPDLTTYDAYYGLPLLCCLSTVAMIAKGTAGDMAIPDTSQKKWVKYFMYGAALLFIPMGSMVPASVGVLWVSNSCFSTLQGVLMRTDKFRQFVGLPTMAAMREKNRLSQAQTAANSKPAASTQPLQYDANKAAADLQARVTKDAQGKPVLYMSNPVQGKQRRMHARK